MSLPSSLPTIPVDIQPLSVNLGTITLDPITIKPITANANIDVTHLAPIHIDPLHISIDDLPTIRLGLEPIRCHVPINMAIGFSLFGKNIACIRFFGETQFIAEPYDPNPCEHCSPPKGK